MFKIHLILAKECLQVSCLHYPTKIHREKRSKKTFPDVEVVKTLNKMWNGLMANPAMLNGGDHTPFICSNDAEAKAEVKKILQSFGWEELNILHLGDISALRGIEVYLTLWLSIFGAIGNRVRDWCR